MNYLTITMAVAYVGALAYVLYVQWRQQNRHDDERREWAAERDRLLDRIQAPSLASYRAEHPSPDRAAPRESPYEVVSDRTGLVRGRRIKPGFDRDEMDN